MRFKSRLCLFALCAFAMLLGLVTAGCSDKDREGGEQSKTKTITYRYTKSPLKGVPSIAEHIYVAAYDAANNELFSKLQNNETNDAWAGYDETSKTYNAVTVVDSETDHMLYTFTYIDEESGKEVEAYTRNVTDVTDLEDGAIVQDSDPEPTEVEYTCKFYGSDGEELPADKVTVGDQFSVRVFATSGTTEEDISSKVDSLAFAPTDLLEEGTAWTYTAKAKGTVKFTAEIEEVEYKDIGSITIVEEEIPGEPALYLCPKNWTVSDNQLHDDKGNVVEDATAIPTFIKNGVMIDDTYTFVVAYKSAEGAFTDVSAEASLSVDPADYVTIEGMEMTAVKPGDITITASYSGLSSTNNLTCNLYYHEEAFLCPAGYSVSEGDLLDAEGNVVADAGTLHGKEISGVYCKDSLGDTPYTFVVVFRQKDGSYVDYSGDVSFTVLDELEEPAEGITFEGLTMSLGTQDEVSASRIFVRASGEYGLGIFNTLEFTPTEYSYKCYICPSGYYVTEGVLHDQDGNEVDVEKIPTTLTITNGDKYTFTCAAFNRDNTLVSTSAEVGSSNESVLDTETQSMQVTACAEGEAQVWVGSETLRLSCQNRITVTVAPKPATPKVYICPPGYAVSQGYLLNAEGSIIADPSEIEGTLYVGYGEELTFVLVSYDEETSDWSEYDIKSSSYYTVCASEGSFSEDNISKDSGTVTVSPGSEVTIASLREEEGDLVYDEQISENAITLEES